MYFLIKYSHLWYVLNSMFELLRFVKNFLLLYFAGKSLPKVAANLASTRFAKSVWKSNDASRENSLCNKSNTRRSLISLHACVEWYWLYPCNLLVKFYFSLFLLSSDYFGALSMSNTNYSWCCPHTLSPRECSPHAHINIYSEE